jgi:hypothetical protein
MGFIVLLALGAAQAQDNSAQSGSSQGSSQSSSSPSGTGQNSPAQEAPAEPPAQQPVPAYGPDRPVAAVSDNPPISGIDLPSLEPHAAPLSYLQPGAHVSESIDSNIEDTLGGSSLGSISRAEGSLELQRLWSHYDLSVDYLGGVGYYNIAKVGFRQVEELGFEQKITWKRGQFAVRDAFSYQPEGTFGGSYGSVGETGAGLAGISGFLPATELGSLGQVPRILNISVGDLVENLTPKSSITALVAYGFVHFLDNEPGTGTAFIGNSEVTSEIGYNRVLGPHDQGAIVYGYQNFEFSTGVNFHTNLMQLLWGHRISGRMDFLIGAGPQFTQLNNILEPATPQDYQNPNCQIGFGSGGLELFCPTNDLRISAAGRAALRYQFPKWAVSMVYQHYLTSGSGFFLGAESDIAHVTANRPLGRIWNISTDLGYARNSRVLPTNCSATATNCPGVSANIYQYGYAGLALHRNFGRTIHFYTSYQFNDLFFDSSYCGTATACNRISQRQVGTIGLDWIPRPIRLD